MKTLALLLALLLVPVAASAFTCTATGCTFTAEYTEPTLNTAGGPVGLTGTTIYYKLDGAPEITVQVPASSPAGGVLIQRPITVPVLPGQKVVITGNVTAKNPAGESARFAVPALTIDRSGEVVPNPPVGGSFK